MSANTHTRACVPPLPRLWLYVQSASILLGCILKSTAATLGFELTEGLIKRVIEWVISYTSRFSWKVLSETVDATTITCFFFNLPSLLLTQHELVLLPSPRAGAVCRESPKNGPFRLKQQSHTYANKCKCQIMLRKKVLWIQNVVLMRHSSRTFSLSVYFWEWQQMTAVYYHLPSSDSASAADLSACGILGIWWYSSTCSRMSGRIKMYVTRGCLPLAALMLGLLEIMALSVHSLLYFTL